MRDYFRAFYLSFFDKQFYRDVANKWHGTGFAYLFLLLVITWIPMMALFHTVVATWVNTVAPQIVEQLPTITIKNGVVSIDKPSPYVIKDPNSETKLAIIDTSGQYTSIDNTPATILLTKDKLLTKNSNNEVNVYDLKSVKSLELTKEKDYKYLNIVKNWAAVVMYPICVFFSFIYRILWALIYTGMGLFVFARMMQVSLNFKQVLRIAVMAMTPSIIIMTILGSMGLVFPLQSFLFLMVTLYYLYFGISANKPAIATK